MPRQCLRHHRKIVRAAGVDISRAAELPVGFNTLGVRGAGSARARVIGLLGSGNVEDMFALWPYVPMVVGPNSN